MMFKIILIITILFLLPFLIFAGICSPVAQIYLNSEIKIEKQIPYGSVLNRFTDFPFSTTSFSKSEIILDSFCGSKDISSIQKLTFQDFSTFDKIKIIINILFVLILVLLPFVFFIIVSKKLKYFWAISILGAIFVIGYIIYLFILWIILLEI